MLGLLALTIGRPGLAEFAVIFDEVARLLYGTGKAFVGDHR